MLCNFTLFTSTLMLPTFMHIVHIIQCKQCKPHYHISPLSFNNSFQRLMSLYFDAVSVLTSPSSAGGSFKSRIYSSRNLKANPAQIYALVTEASKWDILLKEVIENAGILNLEPKVRVKLLQHLESRPAD
jgi:hypothetical protein